MPPSYSPLLSMKKVASSENLSQFIIPSPPSSPRASRHSVRYQEQLQKEMVRSDEVFIS